MIVDLFAGVGGWELGLANQAIGVEIDDAACRTRTRAGHRTIRADVASYPTEPFRGLVSGLIASPPCQDFSVAGKRAGIDGYRGRLVHEVIRWARDLEPDWIACEQVVPVLGIWQDFARVFQSWGYFTWAGILNAADFGVPQVRKRAILMASRKPFSAPQPTHTERPTDDIFGTGLLPWVTMAQALGWGTADRIGFARRNDLNDGHTHRIRDLRPADQPAFALTGKARSWTRRSETEGTKEDELSELEGELSERKDLVPDSTLLLKGGMWSNNNRLYDPSREPAPVVAFGNDSAGWEWELHTRCDQRPDGSTQIVSGDRPATTVTTKSPHQWIFERPSTCVTGRPGTQQGPGWRVDPDDHMQDAEGSVRVTIPEVAVLQSFPADYPWQGSKTRQYQQIGNAIPPLLADGILRELI